MLSKMLNLLIMVIDDLVLLIGIGLISYGVFRIYVPAGFIILGLGFVVMACLIAQRKRL